VTTGTASDTIVLPYGDIAAVERTLTSQAVAAVLTEAVPANMGVVAPAEGFNAALARLCRRHGSLLVFDEVMTGFRVGPAGRWGLEGAAQGWEPDLFTFGKVIGGGLPLAAVAGRAEIMDLLAPAGPVYQAGTLSGNPAAATAGLTTLQLCDEHLYRHLDQTSDAVVELVVEAFTRAGVTHQVARAGNLFSFFFCGAPVRNYEQARQQDTAAFARFFHAMLDGGVWLPPSAFEAWFVSGAHGQAELDQIAAALPAAARAAAGSGHG
jgi:glutamate-1-semialdehyde 2,1-aminomutase